MLDALLTYNTNFVLFGDQHIAMLILVGLATVAVPLLARRHLSEAGQLTLMRVLSLVVAANVPLWIGIRIYLGDFDRTTDLPFDVCNLAAVILPFVMWRPSQRVHEILYFWILTGTLQAILTPHLFNGFPNFTFFKYWIVHGGLVVLVVYATVVFDLYPDWTSLLKSFLWLQAYAAFVYPVNLLLGSNYFYIMHKPPTASLLDYLGPWPWYILVCEGLVLLLFALVYLPVPTLRRRLSAG